MKLTELIIKNVKPKTTKYRLYDENGLYLQVEPNGGKYFRYDFLYAGKKRVVSLGGHPVKTLKDTRSKLYEIKLQLEQGVNPNEVKKTKKFSIY